MKEPSVFFFKKKNRSYFFYYLFALLFLTAILACNNGGGDGDGTSDTDDDNHVANSSPVAQITTPAEGSIYQVGDDIQFTGTGTDSEDGALSGADLVWSSDLSGAIGTGESCSSSDLIQGTHHISLTVTDSGGDTGMDTIAITINPVSVEAALTLPDTGQTTSYTDTFGEDADYTINPPAYTKLDDDGNELDADATDWSMVKDEVTGLIWEVKNDDGSIHDKDNTYNWEDAIDVFIAQLNSDNFCGHSDWRLPTIKELLFLANADTFNPAINTAYFP